MKTYSKTCRRRRLWPVASVVLLAACLAWGILHAEQERVPYIYNNTPDGFEPAIDPQKEPQSQFGRKQGQFGPQDNQAKRNGDAAQRRQEFLDALRGGKQPEGSSRATPRTSSGATTTGNSGQTLSTIKKVTGTSGKELYTMEYREADIQDVVEDIAEITRRNFLVDPKVKGPITIISPTPVDAKAVWQIFLSALAVRDFTIVETGSITKIVPLGDAKSTPIKTYSGKYTPATEGYITRLYTLENVPAREMVDSIKPLVSKRGDVQVYSQTNTLILTDSGENIRRIIKIIGELDQEGAKEQLEVIQLFYANPSEVAEKIKTIFQKEKEPTTTSRRTTRRSRTDTSARSAGSSGDGPLSISNVLPDLRTNSVIVVASEAAVERIKDFVAKIDVEIKDPKGNIHVYYLKHANAEDLATVLANLANGTASGAARGTSQQQTPRSGRTARANQASSQLASTAGVVATLSENVKVASDSQTNSLIITATPQEFEALKKVIEMLDIPRRQVFIETVILELDIEQARSLGVSLSGGADPNGNPIVGATSFTSLNPLALNSSTLAGLSGLSVAGLSKDNVTITLADGTTTSVPQFSAVLQALETSANVNILSTPNILTTDNEEAEIIVGQEVPFPTENGRDSNNNPIISVTRENVAITLRVTPHINEGDFVQLDVFQEVTELIPGQDAATVASVGPTTTLRSADTTVVVRGEQTVVLGGLIDDKTAVSESKVPFLGDIPILGLLFKGRSRETRKRSLLIFLTPYIIDSPADFQKILVRKIEERSNFVKRNYGWIQRREIRSSLENHQEALLDLADQIQADKKRQKKSGDATPSQKQTPKYSDNAVYKKQQDISGVHRREVDLNELLEGY